MSSLSSLVLLLVLAHLCFARPSSSERRMESFVSETKEMVHSLMKLESLLLDEISEKATGNRINRITRRHVPSGGQRRERIGGAIVMG